MSLVVTSPAKLNLFLAITGRRTDGFHELVSVVAPVEFGDTLTIEPRETPGEFTLSCDEASLEIDERNLVLRAAQAFAGALATTGSTTGPNWQGGAHFTLAKRIPIGAGLGGGSSNATAALLALNELAGQPLDRDGLTALAAQLGSDCALFLHNAPVVMRGRGERVQTLPPSAADRLRGRRVLIFKPPFAISTSWAYGQLAASAPGSYLPAPEAETRLADWISDVTAPGEALLYNNMEAPAFTKFVALPVMLEVLRLEFGLAPRMSGSGSACFALLDEDAPVEAISTRVRALWGDTAFVTETRLA